MAGSVERICEVCGSNAGFTQADDGFFYCSYCNSQADDIFDTGIDEEQFFSHYTASCNRVRPSVALAVEPISQIKPDTSQYGDDMEDAMADGPRDFGFSRKKFSYEEYYSEIRSRYVTGLQVMIQLQCRALVEKFSVSPLIIGLVGPLWLRFLASTRVMADDWADKAVHDSESQTQGEVEEIQPSAKFQDEPTNIFGKRLVHIWFRSLRNAIPLHCSLAISYLVCHVAREAILPSDILKWTLGGELPYVAAFSKIETQLGSPSNACPIHTSRMFRPNHTPSLQKLESMAANIANTIGLELSPVNFYAIALRYCRDLSLPVEDILPVSCKICEWSMPSELYLSANEQRIPTRAFVMSVLIVAIRILFDINGYGIWESSLCSSNCSPSPDNNEEGTSLDRNSSSNNPEHCGIESDIQDSRLSTAELLQLLEEKYNELDDLPAYSRDLSSYLQYCKDVVFAGLRPSYEDLEEEKLISDFWEFYQSHKPSTPVDTEPANLSESNKRSSNDSARRSPIPDDTTKDEAIKKMMLDMEENRFCYISPRTRIKRRDYLHYARRKRHMYIYAVHADYYILLRSCAKVARVEARIMHQAVLSVERRLKWLENRIDSTLHIDPSLDYDICNLCRDGAVQNAGNDPMDSNS
ncbi:TATA box-binding protein-associated factor RNA polymerase I subunit B [Andrographis paniculata]|uniref:TATA box-binding protein-associated factor RNA polymerase I subunit B n=1 Tax=Andrographis paniculata TaxID=175694 RepID=UPI0021E72D48|nr:TATA box-binding protein-associated factor RNA polymerase I subunit B [Andrographis paniculata]